MKGARPTSGVSVRSSSKWSDNEQGFSRARREIATQRVGCFLSVVERHAAA